MNSHRYAFGLVLIAILALPLGINAQEHKPYVGSQALEKLKNLAGSWQGMIDMGQGPQPIKTSYKVTSAGSAVVETTFEGTPNEMVTIYHDDKNRKLVMTHYCGLNNQPKMVLSGQKNNTLEFNLSKDTSIDVNQEEHMHALNVIFDSLDKIKQEWLNYSKGNTKKVVIAYERVH